MSGFVQYSVFETACAVNNGQDSSVDGSEEWDKTR